MSSASLLLIGSLGVAILLAFAVFLALVVRDDVAAEVTRLTAVSYGGVTGVSFLVLEAGIPAVIGGVLGWLGGRSPSHSRRLGSADPIAIVAGATLAPGSIAAAGLVILVAVVDRPRDGSRAIVGRRGPLPSSRSP